jgi:hypothetical protein
MLLGQQSYNYITFSREKSLHWRRSFPLLKPSKRNMNQRDPPEKEYSMLLRSIKINKIQKSNNKRVQQTNAQIRHKTEIFIIKTFKKETIFRSTQANNIHYFHESILETLDHIFT